MEANQIKSKKSNRGSIIGGTIALLVIVLIIFFAVRGDDSTDSTIDGTETGVVAEDMRLGPQGEEVGNRVGDLAPDFVTVDYAGNEVRLTDFAGRPVLLNFWATWCPFCVDELPLFSRVQKETDNAFVTLAVDRAESIDRAKSYTDDLQVTDDLEFVVDGSDRIYSRYGGFSMPVSVFIDSEGVIRDIKQGPLTESELKNRLSKILPSE